MFRWGFFPLGNLGHHIKDNNIWRFFNHSSHDMFRLYVNFQAVGGNGAEQTVVSGSMEVLRPCWAVATSGVPVREQLFNVTICHFTHFNLFQHGEFSRSFGRAADVSSLEVATPILIPRSDGHKHRKGSHGDVIFLTNRGEVCYYPTLFFHFSLFQYFKSYLLFIVMMGCFPRKWRKFCRYGIFLNLEWGWYLHNYTWSCDT